MIKFKFFFLIFFLLAFKVAFSASAFYLAETRQTISIEFENQSHFEENNFLFVSFGKFATGQTQILEFSIVSKRFFLNFRLKNLPVSMLPGVCRNKAFMTESVSLAQDSNRGTNEPVYSQMGNLKLYCFTMVN